MFIVPVPQLTQSHHERGCWHKTMCSPTTHPAFTLEPASPSPHTSPPLQLLASHPSHVLQGSALNSHPPFSHHHSLPNKASLVQSHTCQGFGNLQCTGYWIERSLASQGFSEFPALCWIFYTLNWILQQTYMILFSPFYRWGTEKSGGLIVSGHKLFTHSFFRTLKSIAILIHYW